MEQTKTKLKNENLNHLLELFNSMEHLNAEWQCDCYDALIINHKGAGTTLWLKQEDERGFYMLYSTRPEENFRGEAIHYKCLIEISNYINLSNEIYPDFSINIQISIDSLQN